MRGAIRIIKSLSFKDDLVTRSAPNPRVPRADAIQNRAKILAVAIKLFHSHGVNASLEAIAKEAGVGVGTLYRHFPERDDLIAAVLQTREFALQQVIDELDVGTDAAAVLQRWMAALGEYLSSFDGLADPLSRAMMGADSALAISCAWLLRTTERYLASAQSVGVARADISASDLFLLMLASSWITRSVAADEKNLESVRKIIWDGVCSDAVR